MQAGDDTPNDPADPGEGPTRRADPDDLATRHVDPIDDPTVQGLATGRKLFGRYLLEAEIGRGGMGVVWRAHDEELGETVALKILPEIVACDETAVDDLREETRKARKLRHPNIVSVFHFERDGAMAGVSMEWVDGPTLGRKRLEQPGKVLSAGQLAPIVAQLCAALDYAHLQAKIVHRDLKPANILVTAEGVAKITDFGIARALTEASSRLTGKDGEIKGTLPYMSPQQVLGGKPAVVDDIYALGATLYESLTGKPPFFRGGSDILMKQIAEVAPLPLAKQREELGVKGDPIPRVWEETILACLAKKGEDRPQSAGAVAQRLGVWPDPFRQAQGPVLPREFSVTVDPPDIGARLWLGPRSDVEVKDGKALLVDLPDGEQELTVHATGYEPFTTRVTVEDGCGSVEVKLVPVRGAVVVTARPGTQVTAVDERGRETRLGSVPAGGVLEVASLLAVGRYTLKLEHAGCAAVIVPGVILVVGRTVKVASEQSPLPGELRVFSVPSGAEVRVNGTLAGSTPATIKNQPSEQALRVEVFQCGYRRVEQSVTLKPKEARTINLGTLVAEAGGIELRFANGDLRWEQATITIDGKPVAVAQLRRGAALPAPSNLTQGRSETAPLQTAPIRLEDLEVGLRTVEVAHPDYELWQQAVTVRDQETTAVNVDLKPKPGTVACETKPAGARVVISGGDQHETTFSDSRTQAESLTPLRGALPPGRYTLRFELKGYKSATRTATVAANRTSEVSVVLERIRGAEEGQTWTVPDLNLEMAYIRPGTFTMGSPDSEEGRYNDESPQTRVSLTKGYWLGKTEVTQGQYEALMGSNPSNFKNAGRDAPVEQVSWEDAMQFCRKLTERERQAGRLPEGYEYTLPTEAQWEYAGRAGTTSPFAGSANLDSMGWYTSNSGNTTHPVAQKQANAWGLYDMHGNVWEWCRDWSGGYPGGSVTDPMGPSSGSGRVGRGGCWDDDAGGCRSASRVGYVPGGRYYFLGFRLALGSVP